MRPASLAARRYRAVDPDNQLVARGLERAWEESLNALEAAKAELTRRENERPRVLSSEERSRIGTLGPDLATVWTAATTTPRDRKELLGTLIEEVIVKVERDTSAAHLTLRWKGGALTEIDLALPRKRQATVRTDEDTVALVRRLAVHYPDTVIAGILNRQGRRTAKGHRFEGNRVAHLRTYWKIPCFVPKAGAAEGELMTIKRAAIALGVAPSTIHRLLNDGIIAGEQITPGAPWRIRLTDELKARFNAEAAEGFLPMREAIRALGVSRQTVLQRVKRGELEAVHVTRGRQKGLRIKVIARQSERLVHKLDTFTDEQRKAQRRTRALIWRFYRDLKTYRQHPTPQRKAVLRARFDRIFTRKTGFVTLDRLLARLHANKHELLMVLDRPEIPLHTNGSENDVRCQVTKRKVSGGTRSDTGRDCRDAFLGLSKTCAKLGFAFWDYLGSRLAVPNQPEVPYLPAIVRHRCATA